MEINSPTITKICEALTSAQGSMEKASKDSKNPHFKSSYADITSMIDASQKYLSENGISFTSSVVPIDGSFFLIGSLMHTSGEWIRTYIPLLMGKNDMQALGSSITYARRQALSSLCNIATEDDDGSKAKEEPKSFKRTESFATEEEISEIRSVISKISVIDSDFSETKVVEACRIQSLSKIPSSGVDSLLKNLNKKLEILNEKSS